MHWEQIIGLGLMALAAIVVVLLIWPYLVGFLAVVGAVQIYHVWRKRSRQRP
jgi:uncharacterized membrane protein HdeD (DUF308 family)